MEIRDDQHASLLRLARQRGERGFSAIVQDALDRYIETADCEDREQRRKKILALAGSLAGPEGDALAARVAAMRSEVWPDRWATQTS